MTEQVSVRTLQDFVAEAARQLKAGGWRIARCRGGLEDDWHLAARRGGRWRVVQVLVPATQSVRRLQARIRLGQAARLPSKTGTMEQWSGHVRPGGHVIFGHDVLSGTAWGQPEPEPELRARLGLSPLAEAAQPAPAAMRLATAL